MTSAGEQLVRAAVDAWNDEDLEALRALMDKRVKIRSALARHLQADDEYDGPAGMASWFESITQSLVFRLDAQHFVDLGALVLVLGRANARPRSGGPELAREWGGVFQTDGSHITFFETHLSHAGALAAAARMLG